MTTYIARDSTGDASRTAAIPAELLAIAQATRATFGAGVALKFAADEHTGQTWGNPGWDRLWLPVEDDTAQSPPRSAEVAL
jgi:hypothetical protein